MVARGKFRGHDIYYDARHSQWIFGDGVSVEAAWKDRPCGHCGLPSTPQGHDGCLGVLPGAVMNACCGHGEIGEAYVQFSDGTVIRGHVAIAFSRAAQVGCQRVVSQQENDYGYNAESGVG